MTSIKSADNRNIIYEVLAELLLPRVRYTSAFIKGGSGMMGDVVDSCFSSCVQFTHELSVVAKQVTPALGAGGQKFKASLGCISARPRPGVRVGERGTVYQGKGEILCDFQSVLLGICWGFGQK